MIHRLRRSTQTPFRIRTLLLLWMLCVTVACPAAWQSLAATSRDAAAAAALAEQGYAGQARHTDSAAQQTATVVSTGWAWEKLDQEGRQSALSHTAPLPAHREGRPSSSINGRSFGPPAAAALYAAPTLPTPVFQLLPPAWDSGDAALRAPDARGFFSRPPPSLTA